MAPELVQLAGIAETLGVTKRTAQRYIKRNDFPSPVESAIRTGRTWRRSDVERWGKKHLPLPKPGRPKKPDG
jgi:predicted DNA-binding transcriptional regulator AlpA